MATDPTPDRTELLRARSTLTAAQRAEDAAAWAEYHQHDTPGLDQYACRITGRPTGRPRS